MFSVSKALGADPVYETKGWGVHSCVPLYFSANIADHIIDADIYHEASAYFVDEVERIMEVLDDEVAPIEEVWVELEEE